MFLFSFRSLFSRLFSFSSSTQLLEMSENENNARPVSEFYPRDAYELSKSSAGIQSLAKRSVPLMHQPLSPNDALLSGRADK
jgi:hypothetical protein